MDTQCLVHTRSHLLVLLLPTVLIGRNHYIVLLWGGGFIDVRNHPMFMVAKLQVVCVSSEKRFGHGKSRVLPGMLCGCTVGPEYVCPGAGSDSLVPQTIRLRLNTRIVT